MERSYYHSSLKSFLSDDPNSILGLLVKNHEFALEEQQRNAWQYQISILKESLSNLNNGHIFFEFSIPRMGKRVDNILIVNGCVFVIEFKVGENQYHNHSIDQVLDYALDLKNFHEKSHDAALLPILVATESNSCNIEIKSFDDKVYCPILVNKTSLNKATIDILSKINEPHIDPIEWVSSQYKPTPTIIEAAQALYQGHSVHAISRSDSGAINLSRTAECINKIISESKKNNHKSICFITGVPGSGKTLAGLNLANERHKFEEEEHAVFLSGNGPLVEVLQEALARNQKEILNSSIRKSEALTKAKAFIQNIHHFRDDALRTVEPPIEKVVVFDEAQRAWTADQTSSFMIKKKGVPNFNMSEPEFLISIMDRHSSWAVIICLIGGGQEINTGEAGLIEWFSALNNRFKHWKIFISDTITDYEYTRGHSLEELLNNQSIKIEKDLHLNTSIRSFRSENVSNFVKSLLDYDIETAKQLYRQLHIKYPIVMTRDIRKAKEWLNSKCRGTERIGLLASSGAYRLKPHGIFVQLKIEAKNWFLNPKNDIRSSYYLEDVATEFDVQGLELDWTCVSWDADLRIENNQWVYKRFRGTSWQNINDQNSIIYLKNAYRVLLTRARQGMVLFIPEGDEKDITRKSEYYDPIFKLFMKIGISVI